MEMENVNGKRGTRLMGMIEVRAGLTAEEAWKMRSESNLKMK